MMFASGFTWFHLIPTLGHDELIPGMEGATMLAHAWLVSAVLIAMALVGRMALSRAQSRQGIEQYFADDSLTLRTGLEVLSEGWVGLMDLMMDKKNVRIYFSGIIALFLYLFLNNLYGLVPGFAPPTDNVNTTVGIALGVFVLFNVVGLWSDPVGYIKHLIVVTEPWYMLPIGLFLLLPVEILSLLFRPVTLTLRIGGNIFADHAVLGAFSELAPWFIPVPSLVMVLALFVSFMQAFVFTMLTTMYIGMALPHHDDHH